MSIISFYKHWICPLDETTTDPIFGRVAEEDTDLQLYLVETYNLQKDFEGYILLNLEDLKSYRLFKGREEFYEYLQANFIP